jgi:hypothetical protein
MLFCLLLREMAYVLFQTVELNSFYDFEGNATNAGTLPEVAFDQHSAIPSHSCFTELFNWEKDDAILTGKAPFEFRILEAPLTKEQLLKTITMPYKSACDWLLLLQPLLLGALQDLAGI